MKASSWMVLPLVLGISALTVACGTGEDAEVNEQLENEQLETAPTGVDPVEGEAAEEAEEGEGSE